MYCGWPNRLTPLAHLFLLDGPHLIDDAFENALERFRVQWPGIVAGDVFKDLIFALGFVDGHGELALDTADFVHDSGSLVEQVDDLEVQLVDLTAAIRELLKRGLAAEGFDMAEQGAKSKDYGVVGRDEEA